MAKRPNFLNFEKEIHYISHATYKAHIEETWQDFTDGEDIDADIEDWSYEKFQNDVLRLQTFTKLEDSDDQKVNPDDDTTGNLMKKEVRHPDIDTDISIRNEAEENPFPLPRMQEVHTQILPNTMNLIQTNDIARISEVEMCREEFKPDVSCANPADNKLKWLSKELRSYEEREEKLLQRFQREHNRHEEFAVPDENPAEGMMRWLSRERSSYEKERQKQIKKAYLVSYEQLQRFEKQQRLKRSKFQRFLQGAKKLLTCGCVPLNADF